MSTAALVNPPEAVHLAGHADHGHRQRCARCGLILARWSFFPVGESVSVKDDTACKTIAPPDCKVAPIRAKDLRRRNN